PFLHDDDVILHLDPAVRRGGFAVHRLALLTRVAPAGQVLAVEEADEAVLAAAGADGHYEEGQDRKCDSSTRHVVIPPARTGERVSRGGCRAQRGSRPGYIMARP